jgi:hypothetical protein
MLRIEKRTSKRREQREKLPRKFGFRGVNKKYNGNLPLFA